MSRYNIHRDMIHMVAKALGDKLLPQVAFVGGCTTGLLITDEMTKESVRYTDDVDLIIHVLGYSDWHKFSEQLVRRGFRISIDDEVNGRTELGQEFFQAADDVKNYLSAEFKALLLSPDISYAVQSAAGGDFGREQLIFERMENICLR
jgi:hypothetical protein